MYTIPKGNTDTDNLVGASMGASSAPNSGYQTSYDEVVVNYGSVNDSSRLLGPPVDINEA